MYANSIKNNCYAIIIIFLGLVPCIVFAGGITLGGTRVIYPLGQKQVSLSVKNTSANSRFLVQSSVTNANGDKTNDFVVTPPLYVSNPGNESMLRLMHMGEGLPTDKETLYYFSAKSIPSVDKNAIEGKNVLMLAAVTRIKIFVRPKGLSPTSEMAAGMLSFRLHKNYLRIENPSPYFITLVQMKIGGSKLKNTMVPPKGVIDVPVNEKGDLTYRTINDFGTTSKEMKQKL